MGLALMISLSTARYSKRFSQHRHLFTRLSLQLQTFFKKILYDYPNSSVISFMAMSSMTLDLTNFSRNSCVDLDSR